MKRPVQSSIERKMTEKRRRQLQETRVATKITRTILLLVFTLMLVVGVGGYRYVSQALKPYSQSQRIVEVEIPMGSSNRRIAQILQDQRIIRNARLFYMYMKLQNVGDLQAGFYRFSPSMTPKTVVKTLESQGRMASEHEKKVLIREGATIDQIAEEVAKTGVYQKDDFLQLMNDQDFLKKLGQAYPDLLGDSLAANETHYKLEGYLFPATYDVRSGGNLKELVTRMVEKTNQVMTKYSDQIKDSNLNVHQVLTLASLVEKEGVKLEDRKMIAGIFRNRLAKEMMLQSDISVLYALNKHKSFVTIKDTKVDSPYNLYQHTGLGPGPFNNPSEAAIQATLNYKKNDYLYFLANLKTGKVYYAKTYEDHQKLVDEHVNGH